MFLSQITLSEGLLDFLHCSPCLSAFLRFACLNFPYFCSGVISFQRDESNGAVSNLDPLPSTNLSNDLRLS